MKKSDAVQGLIVIIVAVLLLLNISKFPEEAARLPRLVVLVMLLFGAYLTMISLLIKRRKAETGEVASGENYRDLAIAAISIILYIFLISKIGFIVSSVAFLLLAMIVKGQKIATSIIITTATMATLYFVFIIWLAIPLP